MRTNPDQKYSLITFCFQSVLLPTNIGEAQGEPLDSYQKILNFIRTSSTKTGLAVSAYLDRRHYPIASNPLPSNSTSSDLNPTIRCPSGTTPSNPTAIDLHNYFCVAPLHDRRFVHRQYPSAATIV